MHVRVGVVRDAPDQFVHGLFRIAETVRERGIVLGNRRAAEVISLFDQDRLVAEIADQARRLQTRRAAADDEDGV